MLSVLAPISQPIQESPRPFQSDGRNLHQTQSDAFEDELSLSPPRFSIAIDGEDAVNTDDFHDCPPPMSMALEDELEAGEAGRSIEIARRASHERPAGRSSRGSFGSSNRFSIASGLALLDTSQSFFGPEVERISIGRESDGLGLFDQQTDFGDTEELRTALAKTLDRQGDDIDRPQQDQSYDGDTCSPFVLHIPNTDSANPSLGNVSLERLDEVNVGECLQDCASDGEARPKSLLKASKARKNSSLDIPKLPSRITKQIASTFLSTTMGRQSQVGRELLQVIIEAGDQYFEQLGGDLEAFASHAGRKKINESDVIAVMKR